MRALVAAVAAVLAAALPAAAWGQIAPSDDLRAALRAFAVLDHDSDGALTAEDTNRLRRLSSQLVTIMDRNDDGIVDRDEFVISTYRATWWSILDDNGDGAITSTELRARMSPSLIRGLDVNGDGRVTAGELRPGLPAPSPPSPPPMAQTHPRTTERAAPRSQPMIIGDQFYLGLDVEPGDYR